jgi:chromosomal replication initiator protein
MKAPRGHAVYGSAIHSSVDNRGTGGYNPRLSRAGGSKSENDIPGSAEHSEQIRTTTGSTASVTTDQAAGPGYFKAEAKAMLHFWQDCSRLLERELTPQQFSAWIKPLKAIDYDAATGRLKIGAPNRLKLDAIRAQYSARIQAAATSVLQRPVSIVFELQGNGENAPVADAPADDGATAAPEAPAADAQDHPARVPAPAVVPEQFERARLNPALTFDTFVTGKANQLARAAAVQVSENPGGSYNPLFLYGGVGLGKTHLIHAVGNAVLARKPDAKVRYIHAEQYVSDVVRAYQRKAFDEFKRYYHALDLLLIDDIQFFAGKSRTQEEFFYAFEALVAGRKQIIITSDTYPKELKDIDDRLVSRFASGLTVAIEPPELEMRVAILLKKAEQENGELAEEVAFFIAKNLRSNVRELEGALRKVLAFASFHGRPVTVELAREALKDLLSASTGQVTVELIQKTVADYYKMKVSDMYSKRRPNNIALPRQIAMYLAKELTQKSLPEVGELFGGRDHTTVLHAVRKISAERLKNAELNHALHVLEQTLKS